jgi:hypothetical protein
LPERESPLLLPKPVLVSPASAAGKLMNTVSAVAFCGKRHGREKSTRGTKDLIATLGWKQDLLITIDTILTLDCY